MYMQSNQPYSKADSVFDGALTGGATAAMGMGAFHLWGDKATNQVNKLKTSSGASMRESLGKAQEVKRNAQEKSINQNIKNKNFSPKQLQAKAVEDGRAAIKGSEDLKKFNNQSRVNKGARKVGGILESGTKQLGSGKGKAMMYGGSVIAGALVGGLADGAN